MNRLLLSLFGRLPCEWASALGSLLVRRSVPRNNPQVAANARANLKRHKPEASEAELDAMVEAFLDGVGRMMAEFAVIHRLIGEGRIETSGLETLKALSGKEPIIALGLHTGNWETFSPVFQHAGIPFSTFYAPPEDPFERWVAESTRLRFGLELLSPDWKGARDALIRLREGRVVGIFPDEARKGQLMAPLFGRPPHDKGNLAIAARLARHSGARFVTFHAQRVGSCRFHLTFGAPFALPAVEGKADLLADVAFLNAQIEPIVAANIPRWYFLDDSLAPVE